MSRARLAIWTGRVAQLREGVNAAREVARPAQRTYISPRLVLRGPTLADWKMPMPRRQYYLLATIAVALLTTLFFLAMERTASSSSSHDPASVPARIAAEGRAARPDERVT